MIRLLFLCFFVLGGCDNKERINNIQPLYTVRVEWNFRGLWTSYCHNSQQRINLLKQATIYNISRNQWWMAEDGTFVNLSKARQYNVYRE